MSTLDKIYTFVFLLVLVVAGNHAVYNDCNMTYNSDLDICQPQYNYNR
jgi:hypothetical protein